MFLVKLYTLGKMHKPHAVKKLRVVQETCYELIGRHDVPCQRRACKQWIEHSSGKNCMVVTTQTGPLTLNEIGKIYGLTRMRICQIEKSIYQKIRSFIL